MPPGVKVSSPSVVTKLLRAASTLLVAEGVEALSVRRVAKEAGVTTMAIYSRYGGKAGLIDALCAEGFAALERAVSAVPTSDDPVGEVVAICVAYRAVAHEIPGHYTLMFSAEHTSERTVLEALEALDFWYERVGAALGRAGCEDGREAAHTVFALCHGLVHLEALWVGDGDFEGSVRALLEGLTG